MLSANGSKAATGAGAGAAGEFENGSKLSAAATGAAGAEPKSSPKRSTSAAAGAGAGAGDVFFLSTPLILILNFPPEEAPERTLLPRFDANESSLGDGSSEKRASLSYEPPLHQIQHALGEFVKF